MPRISIAGVETEVSQSVYDKLRGSGLKGRLPAYAVPASDEVVAPGVLPKWLTDLPLHVEPNSPKTFKDFMERYAKFDDMSSDEAFNLRDRYRKAYPHVSGLFTATAQSVLTQLASSRRELMKRCTDCGGIRETACLTAGCPKVGAHRQ